MRSQLATQRTASPHRATSPRRGREASVAAPLARVSERSLRTEPALIPALRTDRVDRFAVRTDLRTGSPFPVGSALQKCAGMVLTACAWLAILWGMAHLVIAALHNQAGELGQAVDVTRLAGRILLAAVVLAGAGVPQWVLAERKLAQFRG